MPDQYVQDVVEDFRKANLDAGNRLSGWLEQIEDFAVSREASHSASRTPRCGIAGSTNS